MDLSSLKETLGVRDVRISPGDALPMQDKVGTSLVQEIFSRHCHSTQPESQQLCIILTSIVEVVKLEGLQPTPTALFAALISSLERPETISSPDVALAIFNLLSSVLVRVPDSIIRSKCVQCSLLLVKIMENSDANTAKAALPCLTQFLSSMSGQDWPALSRGFNIILSACLNSHPKLRKKAQSGLVDILAALQTTQTALGPASEAILKSCQRILPGPHAAAQAAAHAPNKKRQQAEEAITNAVRDALHLLGALKQTISLLRRQETKSICELLLQLYPLRQQLLSRTTTDTFAALCASSAPHLTARDLSDIMAAVLSFEDSWDKQDVDAVVALVRFFEQGILRVSAMESDASLDILPKIFSAFIPLLASHQEGIRRGTAHMLRVTLASCIDDRSVLSALQAQDTRAPPGKQRRKLSPLERIISVVESSLTPQYQHAWEYSLGIASELIENIGRDGAPLARGIILQIGEICAGGDDFEAENEEISRVLVAAQDALSTGLCSFGPEYILDILPLSLEEGLSGSDQARTWLLPLLRMHATNARLEYWLEHLMPLARSMGNRGQQAKHDAKRAHEAKVCLALESQLWLTLPSFCSWAVDMNEDVFGKLTKALCAAFERRPDLQTIICRSLRRLSVQTKRSLAVHDHPIGHADPSIAIDDDPGSNQISPKEEEEEDNDEDQIPSHVTLEWGQTALNTLQSHARTWMPLLLNAFTQTPANQRSQLQYAIAGYACLCDASILSPLFKTAISNVMKTTLQAQTGEYGRDAVLEGGDTDIERRNTFMETALALAGGLDKSGIQILYKAAVPGSQQKDPALQKKSYKVLAYICESRSDFYRGGAFTDIVNTLLDGNVYAVSAAKKYRLHCLKAMILELINPDGPEVDIAAISSLQVISEKKSSSGSQKKGGAIALKKERIDQVNQILTPMVSEIILCLKEANKKTRLAAYDLLVEVAHAMHEVQPPSLVDGSGGLKSMVHIILGGLVGSTPHMISASVMALARLLFEFAPVLAGLVPDLLPAILLLLRSKAREVIKSVLGFVKVVAMRLPAEELQSFIPQILEGILIWAEDSKNKFRLKVRVILERIARRCGFEALNASMPESHRALLTHIRKEHSRKERKRQGDSQMDWHADDIAGDHQGVDAKSQRSGVKTVRTSAGQSAWQSDLFSDDDDDDDHDGGVSCSGRSGKHQTIQRNRDDAMDRRSRGGGGTVGQRSVRSAPVIGSSRGLPLSSSGDPLDLLDMSASRRMLRAQGRKSTITNKNKDDDDGKAFGLGAGGRMIISEEDGALSLGEKRKRNRDAVEAGFDSDDSDFEDLKGISGMSLALRGAKSVAQAPSLAASIGGKSLAGRSQGGQSAPGGFHGIGRAKQQNGRGQQHSGDRFKTKKSTAGGDVKGNSKVEPYAYWPLDRKLMNRRAQKAKSAKSGLDTVVSAAKEGAAKGRKAKKMRRS